MTKKKEILTEVLETVSAETDAAVTKIMSRCSDAETVDARWICVKLLRGQGFYPSRIAEMMGITPRYVQHILTNFESRITACRHLRNNYEKSAKKMRKNHLTRTQHL